MHIRDLDLNLLLVFDALLRERSVTRAAVEVGLSQGAMSHALNRLRAFFEDPLFVKTPTGMTPTPKAALLGPSIVGMMTTLREDVVSQAQFHPATARRSFTLCMTDMGELVFLPPLIRQLRREAPDCTLRSLQVPFGQIAGTLATGEADLALGSFRAAPDELFQQQLFMHSFVTMVSVRNTAVGKTITREQFETMRHIVVMLEGPAGAAYDNAFDEYGIRRNVYLSTPHFLVVPLLIDQHPDLIATVPLELGNVFAKLGTVRILPTPVVLPPFGLRQHWHPRFHDDGANIWLRQMIKRTFEHYPDLPDENPPESPPRRRTRLTGVK
ncbi:MULTISPECIES: LysR family transcriptional regulator [Paraburkholderia]|uniref:LysR family transcriptional regulator n=1 Tax=Paraburkholderia TaxID=1822464 RepID=UPI0022569300|nr:MULTISPECIES: LysR family transcriptional regulator [Paraburkholderia]MCX4161588.1 LysR family transcriptional regulator [Paraburkholderia megapolitana]MDN7157084.1 LysR family transcriptional regulator [Paraburkholderia sp. CHISQ3]MDQ6494129.1 LysR family transcriptional regulator [Paraburkholderia megapolitana]